MKRNGSAITEKQDDDPTSKEKAKKPKPEREYFYRDELDNKSTEGKSLCKIVSWNVAGLRSQIKNNGDVFKDFLSTYQPEILCLQETKLQDEHVLECESFFQDQGYLGFWACSQDKKGYSGTVVLIRQSSVKIAPTVVLITGATTGDVASKPSKTLKQQKLKFSSASNATPKESEHSVRASATTSAAVSTITEVLSVVYDVLEEGIGGEGRLITLELDSFYIINCYVPNSGEGLKRLDYRLNTWDPFLREYVANLRSKKPVVCLGDLNVAHLDLDIYNHEAKHIVKQAGLTPQERRSFAELLASGLVDALRHLYPDSRGQFTYWSKRTGALGSNSGLRLDYFLCSSDMTSTDSEEPNHSDCIAKKVEKTSSNFKAATVPKLFDYVSLHEHAIVKCSDHCPIMLLIEL